MNRQSKNLKLKIEPLESTPVSNVTLRIKLKCPTTSATLNPSAARTTCLQLNYQPLFVLRFVSVEIFDYKT